MTKEQEHFVDPYNIPIWRKYTLSVQEAAEYFHLGIKTTKADRGKSQRGFCSLEWFSSADQAKNV